jgi:hypothetical protein
VLPELQAFAGRSIFQIAFSSMPPVEFTWPVTG